MSSSPRVHSTPHDSWRLGRKEADCPPSGASLSHGRNRTRHRRGQRPTPPGAKRLRQAPPRSRSAHRPPPPARKTAPGVHLRAPPLGPPASCRPSGAFAPSPQWNHYDRKSASGALEGVLLFEDPAPVPGQVEWAARRVEAAACRFAFRHQRLWPVKALAVGDGSNATRPRVYLRTVTILPGAWSATTESGGLDAAGCRVYS
jgi:hypothetical protein